MDYIVHGIAESDTTEQLSLPLSQVVLVIKNLPAMQETWVRFLDQEVPLKKETRSSILAWRIP